MYHVQPVDQAGSERTEAGESALPAEESSSAGTGRAQTLRNLQPVNLSECQTDLSGLSLFEGLDMNRILRARIQQQGKSTQNAERADSSVNTVV